MEGREHSGLFHWEQSLHKHTKKLVLPQYRHVHLDMCETWRLARTSESAKIQAKRIKAGGKKEMFQRRILKLLVDGLIGGRKEYFIGEVNKRRYNLFLYSLNGLIGGRKKYFIG